jgi:hypothetical protein
MDQVPDFTSLPLGERLRFWANFGARAARQRGEVAKWTAEMEAGALQIGVELIGVHDDAIEWKGRPTEPVLAERPVFEDDDLLDDDDQDEPGPWPVNVEKDLFERLRAANFDLDDLLATHAEVLHERGDHVLATVGRLTADESLAVLTVSDVLLEVKATFVFSMTRGA